MADLKSALGMMGSMGHSEPDADDEEVGEHEAAKSLISAIRKGDPDEVAMAFKELKRACSYSEESSADEEG